jgi:hypothetical protein
VKSPRAEQSGLAVVLSSSNGVFWGDTDGDGVEGKPAPSDPSS